MDSHGAVNIQTNKRRKKSHVFGSFSWKLKANHCHCKRLYCMLLLVYTVQQYKDFIELNGCAKALYFHSASVSYVVNLVTRKPDWNLCFAPSTENY